MHRDAYFTKKENSNKHKFDSVRYKKTILNFTAHATDYLFLYKE